MTRTASRAPAMLALILALLGAGCLLSSDVTALTFRTENGTVLSEVWNGAAECRVAPGAEPPCATRTNRRQEAVVADEVFSIDDAPNRRTSPPMRHR